MSTVASNPCYAATEIRENVVIDFASDKFTKPLDASSLGKKIARWLNAQGMP
jgi:hypothetical protein